MTTFTGCGTALVTPFRKDQSLDEETLRKLVRRQIQAGINFLVPCGTTGESPTLTHAEHLRVVEITLEEAKGKVPVLAGAGGYNTAEVIELAKELQPHGRRRHPVRHAVLQQAHAGRPRPALQSDRQRRSAADRRVQHSGTHRRQRRACYSQASCGNRKHCRRERSVGKHRADGRRASPASRIVHRC